MTCVSGTGRGREAGGHSLALNRQGVQSPAAELPGTCMPHHPSTHAIPANIEDHPWPWCPTAGRLKPVPTSPDCLQEPQAGGFWISQLLFILLLLAYMTLSENKEFAKPVNPTILEKSFGPSRAVNQQKNLHLCRAIAFENPRSRLESPARLSWIPHMGRACTPVNPLPRHSAFRRHSYRFAKRTSCHEHRRGVSETTILSHGLQRQSPEQTPRNPNLFLGQSPSLEPSAYATVESNTRTFFQPDLLRSMKAL